MPRKETPLGAGDGPLLDFAAGLRRLRTSAGSPPYRKLAERAHYSVSTLSSAASGLRLPTLAVTLAYVGACGGDPREWERRWRETAGRLGGQRPGPGTSEEAQAPPPYAGLRPFREQDAQWFFGREQLVEELVGRLARQRFVVLLGASGSGKSSLLRAGLAPALRPSAAPVLLTPGPRPLEECAVRLGALAGLAPGGLYRELREDPENLGRVLRQTTARSGGPGGPAVLIVDQFEEVFTLCQDGRERGCFIEALVAAAADRPGGCRVVLGVRADFYAHCVRDSALAGAMRQARVPLGPMSPDELRRAVVQPARRAGLTVEGALLATLTAQAHGRAGALPLLSHALLETWHRRRGNLLTLAGLEAVGGIEGALVESAEAFYTDLDPEQRGAARRLLLRLTAPGAGTEDTTRRMTHGEQGDDAATVAVVERAAAARLVSLDEERMEITHEALISSWPRLREWLSADRDQRRAHHRLTEAAAVWAATGEDPDALCRGAGLQTARRLAESADVGLSAREQAFLSASLAAEAAETRSAARRTRRLRVLLAALGLMTVLATVATVLSVRATREVTRQRNDAVALNAAAAATRTYAADPEFAVQLALASYRLRPRRTTRDALLSTLMTTWAAHRAEAYTLDVSDDGALLAVGSRDHTVSLWDIRDPGRPVRAGTVTGHTEAVHAVALSPGRRILATAGADRTVRLWDAARPLRPAALSVLTGPGGGVHAVAFSPDGRLLAGGHRDGTVSVWGIGNTRRPRLRAALGGHSDTVRSLAFSADGRLLATTGQDGAVRVWDLGGSGGPSPRATWNAHELGAFWAEFHPRGRLLATAGGGREAVRLWDVTDPDRPRRVSGITGHSDVVGHLAFSPDGRTLATASDDRSVGIWDVGSPAAPRGKAVLGAYATAVMGVRYTPDGRTLLTGVFDGTVRLLPTDFGRAVAHACDGGRPPLTRDAWHRHLPGIPYRPPCG
ncbi:XRE family transcriptional regulator [Streptomyces spongiicola]|uniref:XRE family transcriptional regulator n=1 Tax=Streptomyces spongiicola TaxID=1690221 RepID=A0ABM6VFN4_9ACTN|nr:XRE family transcriptional regulator [Streptomyces spongiicola]AWK12516.1 XRE family transcriptional regulator [Streptomyces spongiicola]